MKRRPILAALAGSVAWVGCLGDATVRDDEAGDDGSGTSPSDGATLDTHYERCENRIVRISQLPEEAASEAHAAIEEGSYESDDPPLLTAVIRMDEAYLLDDETYYRPATTTDDEATILTLEESLPAFQEPVTLENMLAEEVTFDLRIEHERSDDVVLEESMTLAPDERVTLTDEEPFPFGTYQATVEGEDLYAEVSWTLDQRYESGYAFPIELDDNGLFTDPVDRDSSYGPCSWGDDGTVSTGH